jgi:uncharacterized membrane protein YeaQ/YmgE (transglycosylase-associated protein family)
MALALWAITGLVVGLLFALIMGTGKYGGFWGYVLLGTVGALLGGLLIRVLVGASLLNSWAFAIMAGAAGTVILMVIAIMARRRTATTKT